MIPINVVQKRRKKGRISTIVFFKIITMLNLLDINDKRSAILENKHVRTGGHIENAHSWIDNGYMPVPVLFMTDPNFSGQMEMIKKMNIPVIR